MIGRGDGDGVEVFALEHLAEVWSHRDERRRDAEVLRVPFAGGDGIAAGPDAPYRENVITENAGTVTISQDLTLASLRDKISCGPRASGPVPTWSCSA